MCSLAPRSSLPSGFREDCRPPQPPCAPESPARTGRPLHSISQAIWSGLPFWTCRLPALSPVMLPEPSGGRVQRGTCSSYLPWVSVRRHQLVAASCSVQVSRSMIFESALWWPPMHTKTRQQSAEETSGSQVSLHGVYSSQSCSGFVAARRAGRRLQVTYNALGR